MNTKDNSSNQPLRAKDGTPAMEAPRLLQKSKPSEEEVQACGSILILNATSQPKTSSDTKGASDKTDPSVITSNETSPGSDKLSESEGNTSSHSAPFQIGKEPLKRKQSSQEGNARRKRKLPLQSSFAKKESLGENSPSKISPTETSGNSVATDSNKHNARQEEDSNHPANDRHDNTKSESAIIEDAAKKRVETHLEASWEENFRKLVEYKIKYGTTNVNPPHDRSLSIWVCRQRKLSHRLTHYQAKLLDSIDYDWNGGAHEIRKDEWMRMYNQLVEYKEEYGNTHVPTQPKIFASLGFWADRQRKIGMGLQQWRIELLDKIGFVWDSKGKDNWMKMYQELVEFKKKYKTTFVSRTVNAKLAGWCRFQRNQCKEQWRIDLLNEIGFIWSPKSEQQKDHWMKMYNDMVDYKKRFGTTCVPLSWKENRRLGIWVRNQRVGCTEQWRIDLLNKVDFVWSVYSHKKQEKAPPLPPSGEASNINIEKK